MKLAARLKRVYWESTASCNLRCIHCRRLDVLDQPSTEQLSTEEAKAMLRDLRAMGRPVFIFSGGEPLVRADFFELAAYAKSLELPIALATNGTLVDAAMAQRLRDVGIYYASISLDGATAGTHDRFRGLGNYERALEGMAHLQKAGVKVQVNFTVTRLNAGDVPAIYELCRDRKAIALYLFLLVPVGCGVEIAESQMLDMQQVDEWLRWVVAKEKEGPLPIKAICAPQVFRVEHEQQETTRSIASERQGCLAGIHMAFISHKGEVFPCGYLPLPAGNIRTTPFAQIWNESQLFDVLRDPDALKGRCGACDFKSVCGGCRARALYAESDVLAEEPYCTFVPALF